MSQAPSQTEVRLDRIHPDLPPIGVPGTQTEPGLLERALRAASRGREFLLSTQRTDHRWCAELESNPTITAEYVFLQQILKRDLGERKARIVRYFLGLQNLDGSWGIARPWDGDVSTTAEVYLALRILGLERGHPALESAESFILRNGGLERIRIFTRISFAMFGLMPWRAIPALPPEIILLPDQAPVNVYALSSWARGTMVPLFVIFHHQPVFALPNGESRDNPWLDHLWLNPRDKAVPYSAPWVRLLREHGLGWKSFFCATDACMKLYDRVRPEVLRKRAIERCVQWILDRQEESGDWAGIFPPMLNGMIALTLEGFSLGSEPIRKGLEAMESLAWEDPSGLRIQASNSPVWDTILSTISLIDSGSDPEVPELRGAVDWLLHRQLLGDYGDWKVRRPGLAPGGWSFEYSNSWYPDVDDTAAAVLALLKQDPASAATAPVLRAFEWILGMQNRDGGWAAFDVDNDKLFLNEIPFADIDALCDPSSPDVTGRVLEAIGLSLDSASSIPDGLHDRMEAACRRALRYLRKHQETQGSWFGRWGVNYIYGTSNVLCGLARLRVPRTDPMIEPALQWLQHCQNSDGGWGESIASYADRAWMGKGESTASQTAWALMALLSYLPPETPCVRRGIRWLVDHQVDAQPVEAFEGGVRVPEARGGTWNEEAFTGTGFPKHFYLRYHLYRHYFPMMALGRFIRAHES